MTRLVHSLTLVLLLFAAASVALAAIGAQAGSSSELIFDVRNGDQQGKLVLQDAELSFESLTDARHSRKWKYADIRELTRKSKELRVRPFQGERYNFQFKDKQVRDRIYDLIAARILTARQTKK